MKGNWYLRGHSRGKYLWRQTHRDPFVLSSVTSGKRRAWLSLRFVKGRKSIVIVLHWRGGMSQSQPLGTALTVCK